MRSCRRPLILWKLLPLTQNKEVEQNVNIIHKKLYLYLRRNQRVDFFAIDEQLIKDYVNQKQLPNNQK